MKPLMRPSRGQGAWRLCVLGALGLLAATLAGCASAVTQLSEYPAVHDVPPTRAEKTLSDAEQVKLQQELTQAGQAVPARVEAIERADAPQPAQPAKPAARPADAKKQPAQQPVQPPAQQPARQAAGTRTNP